MARVEEVTVTLVDDFDGTEAAETIAFSFDGKAYEIDLSKANASELRRIFKPYIEHARAVKAPTRRSRTLGSRGKKASGGRSVDQAAVRAWAKAHRIKVAPRGRIANDVVERWRKATKG